MNLRNPSGGCTLSKCARLSTLTKINQCIALIGDGKALEGHRLKGIPMDTRRTDTNTTHPLPRERLGRAVFASFRAVSIGRPLRVLTRFPCYRPQHLRRLKCVKPSQKFRTLRALRHAHTQKIQGQADPSKAATIAHASCCGGPPLFLYLFSMQTTWNP